MGAYSPQDQSGGVLHFPSPTHIHQVDPASAFRQLRRSLSRSPSKISAFRLVTSKSTSPTPASPLSPPQSCTPIRSLSENLLSPSPLASPSTASARRTRQSNRKLSPLRHSSRPTSTPRSPRKRTLQESSNQGNALPRSSADFSEDQENRRRSPTPGCDPMQDVAFKISEFNPQSSPFAPPRAVAKFERGYNSWSAKSSPLKRSDGTMERDQGHRTSPSAKRRSLHGGIFGPDFDVFDQMGGMDSQIDTRMANSPCDNDRSSVREMSSPFVGRSSSLRKTTLQQRQEKPAIPRSKPQSDPVFEFSSPAQSVGKNRARLSFEGPIPSVSRDSPFSSQGGLPNASIHPMFQPGKAIDPRLTSKAQRHPLSRTISQSTSASSLAEDSPTHAPVRQPEQRRQFLDFSKSLPIGADRPSAESSQVDSQSSNFSFETPVNYKLVKPLPAAFMSTGLISKKHKNPITSQANFGASTSTMPDTPCKRHSLAEFPSPTAPRADFSVKPERKRHSFGTPPAPGREPANETPAIFGREFGIFAKSENKVRLDRSTSFYSIDGDEASQSPSRNFDSQSSAEVDIPPTPTRHFVGSHHGQPATGKNKATESNGGFKVPNNAIPFNSSAAGDTNRHSTCKYESHSGKMVIADEDSDDRMDDSPSVNLRFRSFPSFSRSFTHSRLLRNSKSPTPLNRASFSTPAILARRSLAKRSPLSPASPSENSSYHLSPRTPKDSVMPPDPSGLSISRHGEYQIRSVEKAESANSMFPPATPTASREYFFRSGIGATPSHLGAPVDVDPALTSRFDRAELIGSGEFSQVYRVSRKQELRTSTSYFSMPLAHRSPKTSMPDRVWAVKKTRNAYIGQKDRQRKLREVEVLKALGQSEHALQFVDSWEHHNRLYIQTEFCEEGSLDVFLEKQGSRARLDDFRIWKILLELSLGLKHIHDLGFIHLDLKPANVLITFEGSLKIADFGMATRWPAQSGIDGEGDREYIGPEILRGEFDKPADIFALGLIMLEIAGNVVLPDNGVSWQRLRSGDMSDVPSLTWSSESSKVARDSSGEPISREDSFGSDIQDDGFSSFSTQQRKQAHKIVLQYRSGELAQPPSFMADPNDAEALDSLVRWMISPEAGDRPVVDQMLSTHAVQWVDGRRRAGATIFEGSWGPADDVLADDAEMIDV